MTVIIPLTQGQQTVVSDEDADLAELNWCAGFYPSYTGGGQHVAVRRAYIGGKWRSVLLHRVILSRVLGRELDSSEFTDHIDGNPLNNRRENLRLANRSQNGANRGKDQRNSVGLKGVTFIKSTGKYRAQIWHNRKNHYLGVFHAPQEAHEAYKQAARELFGEFARFE